MTVLEFTSVLYSYISNWSSAHSKNKSSVYLNFMQGNWETDIDTDTNPYGEENFFFIEPSAQLEVNLMKNIRFHTGIAYRIVGNMDYRALDQSDISGLTGVAGLKIGLFR